MQYQNCGNDRIDHAVPWSFFTLFCKEMNLKPEQKENIKNVDYNCILPDSESYRNRLEKFLKVQIDAKRKKLTGKDLEKFDKEINEGSKKKFSLAKRYIVYFWFRHLPYDLGWNRKNKEQVADLIISMIHYWPKSRKTAEELLQDDIFMKDGKSSELQGVFSTHASIKKAKDLGRQLSITVSETAERMLASSKPRNSKRFTDSNDDEIQVFLKKLSKTESFISLDIGYTVDFTDDDGYKKISKIDNIDRIVLVNLAKVGEPPNYHFLSNDDIIYSKLKKIYRKLHAAKLSSPGSDDDLFKENSTELGSTKSKKLIEMNRNRNFTYVNAWKKGTQKTIRFPTNERHSPLRSELGSPVSPGFIKDFGFGDDAVMMD